MAGPTDIRGVDSVDGVVSALAAQDYLADEGLATAVFLALRLRRPLLLEGEAGVGKTEVAKALATWSGGELIRLQCYEGLDINHAVYEWNHARQILDSRGNPTVEVDVITDDGAVGRAPYGGHSRRRAHTHRR